jgi:ABC-2 type transport system permease protein
LTIAAKDLRLVLRDRAALLFLLVVPILVITVVASTLGAGEERRLLLPVVNLDEGPVAEILIEVLSEHAEVALVDRASAEELVRGELRTGAALVLPERLSKSYLAGRPSTLLLLTDPAKNVELETTKAHLLQAEREAATLADPLAEELLRIEERPLVGRRLSISSFEQNVPGFSVMFVLMGVLFGVAFGLRDERDCGGFVRLRIAPIHPFQVVSGKLLARFLVGTIQMLILFAFGRVAFGISLGPSLPVFVFLVAAIVFALTGFSLPVAAIARTREQIIPLGLTVVMIVCAVGGCWWPLFQEPQWLQEAARITPTAWAMRGLSDLILRDLPPAEILPTAGLLVAYGAGCLALGVRLLRLGERDS